MSWTDNAARGYGAGLDRTARTYSPTRDIAGVVAAWHSPSQLANSGAPDYHVTSGWIDSVGGRVALPSDVDIPVIGQDVYAKRKAAVSLNTVDPSRRFEEVTGALSSVFEGTASYTVLCVCRASSSSDRAFSIAAGASPGARVEVRPSFGLTISDGVSTTDFPHGKSVAPGAVSFPFAVAYNGAGSARFVVADRMLTITGTHRTVTGLDRYNLGNLVGANNAVMALSEIYICNSRISDALIAEWYLSKKAEYVSA